MTPRIARVLLAGLYLFPLASLVWLVSSISGAELLARKLETLGKGLGVGTLQLSFQEPLYKGLHAGPGSFVDAKSHPWARWEGFSIPGLRYRRGEFLLESLVVRGLKLKLKASPPSLADPRDWLTQTSEALELHPLKEFPALHVKALTLEELRLEKPNGQELLALRKAQLSTRSNHEGIALWLHAEDAQLALTRIAELKLEANWQAPQLEIARLSMDSDLLKAKLQELRFDGDSSLWTIGPSRFELLASPAYGQGSLELRPDKDELRGELHYEAPGGYRTQSSLQASLSDLRNARLQLHSQCEPCGQLPGSWTNKLELQGDLVRSRLRAQSQLRAPEQSFDAALSYTPQRPASLELGWSSRSLSKIVQSLQGRSQGKAKCTLDKSSSKLDCDLSLALQELYPDTQSRAELSVSASPSTGVEARFNSLQLQAFKQVVHNKDSHAIVRYLPDGSIFVEDLDLRSLDGQASLTLDAQRGSQGQLKADLQAERWELALLSAFVPTLGLSGRLDLSLSLRSDKEHLEAEMLGQARRLRWRGLSWGTLSLRAKQQADALHIRAKLYGSRIAKLSLKAQVPLQAGLPPALATDQRSLRAQLALDHFDDVAWAKLLPRSELGGSLRAKLQVRGSLRAARATLAAQWNNARWKSYVLDSVDVDAQLDSRTLRAELRSRRGPQEKLVAKARLGLQGGHALGDLRWNPRKNVDLELKLHSFKLAPLASLFGQRRVRGQLSAALRLSGSTRTPEVRAWLSAWEPGYAEYSAQNLNFSLVHKAKRSRIELAFFRGQGKVDATASIPLDLSLSPLKLDWRARQPHRVDLHLRELDSQALAGLVDLPEVLRAHGELHAKGNLHKHQIWGELTTDSPKKELRNVAMKANFRLSETQQRLQLRAIHKKKTVLRAKATLQRGLRTLIEQKQPWENTPAQVHVQANRFALQELEPWLPMSLHEPGGYFSAKLGGQGPLGALTLKGQAQIRSGKIAIVPLQQRIEKIRMRMSVKQGQLRLDTLSAKVGRGSLAAAGKLRLSAAPSGSLSIKLDKIPLRIPGAPSVEISSKIRSKIEANAKTITVNSSLHNTKVQVTELLTPDVKSIPSNSNIRYSDEIIVSKPRNSPPVHAPALQLNSRIADAILVQGPLLATSWTGYLDLSQDRKGMRAKGRLKSSPGGSFDLLNNHFNLERARLEFSTSDALIPYLDLRTSTEVDGESISITAQGPANRPRLSFESSSNASREEVISTLLTGSSRRDQGGDNKLLTQALSALMLENGKSLRQFSQRLGLDNVRFSFGESLSDTIVSAGSWVSPKVYLESKIRAQAPEGKSRVEGHVRYNFRRDWVLEGYVGDRNAGGGGIWWHRPPRVTRFRRAKPAKQEKAPTKKPPAKR